MNIASDRGIFVPVRKPADGISKQRRWYLIIPVSLALFPASHAWAADAPGAGTQAEQVDGTIVVTARKRTESIQKVPSSIRALGAEELTRLGANSIEQYAGQAPGLSISGNRANTQLVMRGVSTGPVNQDQSEIGETVGYYLDETPIAVQRFTPNLALYDLERVEVLRGPQGTLYGAGSMAGAIRLITAKPDTASVEASARGQVGQVDRGGTNASVDAMINLPVVQDILALRAVGFYHHIAGFIDNVVTGESNVNSGATKGGRMALRATPDESTTIDTMAFYQKTTYDGRTLYTKSAGFLNTNVPFNEPQRDRNLIVSATLRHQMKPFDMVLTGAYFDKRLNYSYDASLTGAFVPGVGAAFTTLPLATLDSASRQKSYNAELRFSSKVDSVIEWTIGSFYERKRSNFAQRITIPGVDALSGIDNTLFGSDADTLLKNDIGLRQRQVAIFGEVVLPVTSRLKATAGGRYFDSRQSSHLVFGGIFSDPGTTNYRAKEHGFNPKFNLSYEIDPDRLVYAQAAKGFRLGGTSEPVPVFCKGELPSLGLTEADIKPTYRSDSLWSYEAGAKIGWLGRALTVNTSYYHIDWKNPQLALKFPICGFNILANGGKLKVDGGEVEMIVRPAPSLTIKVGLSYNKSRLTEDVQLINARRGDRAPFVPPWSMSGSIDYEPRFNEGLKGLFFLGYQGTDIRNTQFNTTLGSNRRLPAYDLITARAGVSADRWALNLFVENAGNSHGITNSSFYGNSINAREQVEPVTPRTVGVELSVYY